MKKLQDKVAIVFGAGSAAPGWSNGKATAVALAREGARVIAVDLQPHAAQETAEIIRGEGGICEATVADVTCSADVKRVVDDCIARYDRIDILQNNVGVTHLGGPVEMSEETWMMSMKLNVGSAFLACKHVLPVMERQGSGVITNISSIAALRWVGVDWIGYASFKAALNHFTVCVAMQYARKGIRANVVVPGRMDTPMLRLALGSQYARIEDLLEDKAAICPTGKLGDPWDVAYTSVFLASNEAKYITGAMIPVDGGVHCQA